MSIVAGHRGVEYGVSATVRRTRRGNCALPTGRARVDTASRGLPCRIGDDPDLWFSEAPAELERAKQLCGGCLNRSRCLSDALDRSEPWGVWGGEIVHRGVVVAHKRGRGRPRTSAAACGTVKP